MDLNQNYFTISLLTRSNQVKLANGCGGFYRKFRLTYQ